MVVWAVDVSPTIAVDISSTMLNLTDVCTGEGFRKPNETRRIWQHHSKRWKSTVRCDDLLLRVDLKPHTNVLGLVLDIFVNTSGTKSIFNPLVLGPLKLRMFVPILHL